METLILGTHLSALAVMTVLIWVTQLRTYPRFASVPAERFRDYHDRYRIRVSLVAAPAMIAELVSGAYLLFRPPDGFNGMLFGISVILIAPIWLSTFAVQVPLHERLAAGFDRGAHRRLVSTNRIRTALWSLRVLLICLAAAF
jgi:hypothetical protein